MADKIDKIQQQIQALKEQLKKEKSKQATRERKIDTRKKILLGAMLMHWVEVGEVSEADLLKGLDKFLTRELDRTLFGLSSVSESQVSITKKNTQAANNSPTDTTSKPSDELKIQKSTTSNKESRSSRLNTVTSSEDIEKEFNL